MGAVVVAFLLALPAQADEPRIVDVERATVTTRTGAHLELDGGAWLSDAQLLDLARDRVRLREENAALKASAGQVDARYIVAAAVIGLAVGSLVGAGVARATQR